MQEHFLKDFERIPADWQEPIKRYFELIRLHFKDSFIGALVYGSVAKGTAQPYKSKKSDADLLLVFENLPPEKELDDIRSEMYWKRPGGIEALWVTKADLAGYLSRKPGFILDAFADGIIFYDPQGYLASMKEKLFKELAEKGVRRTSWAWIWPIKAGEKIEY